MTARKKKPTAFETAIVKERARRLSAWNQEWTQQQLRRGVDGPVPPGRKDPSDYNQHVPMMEASDVAQDLFFDRANVIMNMGPDELGLKAEDFPEE